MNRVRDAADRFILSVDAWLWPTTWNRSLRMILTGQLIGLLVAAVIGVAMFVM